MALGLYHHLFYLHRAWQWFFSSSIRHHWSALASFAPACVWSEHLSSWSFTFAAKCFALAVSLFQPQFPWVVLRSEVVIQSLYAGIHFCERASLIVWLLCCGVCFFNDWTVIHFHFCFYKLNWYLTAGCLRRQRQACRFSMERRRMVTRSEIRFLFLQDYSSVLAFILSTFIPAFLPCRNRLSTGIAAKVWWSS